MKQKYRLTDETIKHNGATLYRIEALRDFGDVTAGDKGGFVQSEINLSQEGDCWIYDEAAVYGTAMVCGKAMVCGEAEVCGESIIKSIQDYIVFKNWWSSGRYFTWTKSNNMWKVGCFYGTGEELIHKAYADSEESGREYERVLRYIKSIITKN